MAHQQLKLPLIFFAKANKLETFLEFGFAKKSNENNKNCTGPVLEFANVEFEFRKNNYVD